MSHRGRALPSRGRGEDSF